MTCPYCHEHTVLWCHHCEKQPSNPGGNMILKDNGGSMKKLVDQVASIRSSLIADLDEWTRELYEDLPSDCYDMDGARSFWEELPLDELKHEHRTIKERVEHYRAAKAKGEA